MMNSIQTGSGREVGRRKSSGDGRFHRACLRIIGCRVCGEGATTAWYESGVPLVAQFSLLPEFLTTELLIESIQCPDDELFYVVTVVRNKVVLLIQHSVALL